MDVGVRELKQRLSHFLNRAARGEVIRITERGRPKAVLGPLPGRVQLDEGIAEGWIRPGSDQPPAPVRRFKSRMRLIDLLSEDRGE
jgi:prevent-host-death family protein